MKKHYQSPSSMIIEGELNLLSVNSLNSIAGNSDIDLGGESNSDPIVRSRMDFFWDEDE